MKKGQFAAWLVMIFGVIIFVIGMIFVSFSISKDSKDKNKFLLLDSYDYSTKQELNQFLSTSMNFNDKNYVVIADSIGGFFHDEDMKPILSHKVNEFFGGGDIFKQHKLVPGESNLVMVLIMDDTLKQALNDASDAAKVDIGNSITSGSAISTTWKLFNLDKEALKVSMIAQIAFLQTALKEPVSKAMLYISPEKTVKRLAKDEEFSVAATNIIDPAGELITVILIKRNK